MVLVRQKGLTSEDSDHEAHKQILANGGRVIQSGSPSSSEEKLTLLSVWPVWGWGEFSHNTMAILSSTERFGSFHLPRTVVRVSDLQVQESNTGDGIPAPGKLINLYEPVSMDAKMG